MAHLICEGACNPRITLIDQAVRGWREDEWTSHDRGNREPVPDHLADWLRTLKHTDHVPAETVTWRESRRWACGTCGHVRQWGV